MISGRPTSTKAPSTILAFSSRRFVVKDRLTPVVRVESKVRKYRDRLSIEASLCHSETIESRLGGTSGESSGVVEDAIPGPVVPFSVCSAWKQGDSKSLILVAEDY